MGQAPIVSMLKLSVEIAMRSEPVSALSSAQVANGTGTDRVYAGTQSGDCNAIGASPICSRSLQTSHSF
jgi:hypothetical protein